MKLIVLANGKLLICKIYDLLYLVYYEFIILYDCITLSCHDNFYFFRGLPGAKPVPFRWYGNLGELWSVFISTKLVVCTAITCNQAFRGKGKARYKCWLKRTYSYQILVFSCDWSNVKTITSGLFSGLHNMKHMASERYNNFLKALSKSVSDLKVNNLKPE